jgi:hypothetical protein
LTRALAFRGEILVIPPASTNAGCRETWRALLGAIENLALVVSTHNMVQPGGRGLAFVAAPEELL